MLLLENSVCKSSEPQDRKVQVTEQVLQLVWNRGLESDWQRHMHNLNAEHGQPLSMAVDE
jgi:hypothetical protein